MKPASPEANLVPRAASLPVVKEPGAVVQPRSRRARPPSTANTAQSAGLLKPAWSAMRPREVLVEPDQRELPGRRDEQPLFSIRLEPLEASVRHGTRPPL